MNQLLERKTTTGAQVIGLELMADLSALNICIVAALTAWFPAGQSSPTTMDLLVLFFMLSSLFLHFVLWLGAAVFLRTRGIRNVFPSAA